jgi:hypothetical protein
MQLSRLLRLLPLIAPLFITTVARAQSADPPVTGKGLVGGALLGGEVVLLTEAAIKVKPAWAYYLGGGLGMIGGGIGGHYLESSLSSKEAMYMLSAGILLVIPTTVAALNAVSYDTPLEYTQDTPPSDQPSDDSLEGGMQPNPASNMPTMPAVNPQNAPPVPAPASSPPPAAPATPLPAAAPPPASAPPANANPTSSPTPDQPQGSRLQHGSRAVAHWRAAPVILPPALLDISGNELALTVPAVEIRDTYTRREVAMYGVKQQTEVRVPLFQMVF